MKKALNIDYGSNKIKTNDKNKNEVFTELIIDSVSLSADYPSLILWAALYVETFSGRKLSLGCGKEKLSTFMTEKLLKNSPVIRVLGGQL